MSAYLLFAGNNYYPGGGFSDYQGDFDSINDAISHFKAGYFAEWDEGRDYRKFWDWYQVVRRVDMKLVTDSSSAFRE